LDIVFWILDIADGRLTMSDCIFCKIAAGDIPSNPVYEDEEILAFEDISPKAPVHILIIPKQHLATLNDAGQDHSSLLGRLLLRAAELARERGVAEEGYRVLTNCNSAGGQEVFHLHFHLLGGRKMGEMG
jgi:histidine triad (HIT) family protein